MEARLKTKQGCPKGSPSDAVHMSSKLVGPEQSTTPKKLPAAADTPGCWGYSTGVSGSWFYHSPLWSNPPGGVGAGMGLTTWDWFGQQRVVKVGIEFGLPELSRLPNIGSSHTLQLTKLQCVREDNLNSQLVLTHVALSIRS